jgi:hypothetical protein
MGWFPTFLFIIEVGDDGIARQRFEWQRCNELLGIGCEDRPNVGPGLGEQRRQISRFVRGNRPCDT